MHRHRGWNRGVRITAAMLAASAVLVACSGGEGDPVAEPTTTPGATSATPSESGAPSSSSGSGETQGGTEGDAVTQLVAWGDSLTAGSGGDGTTYPGELAKLAGLPVFNGGVPGERSAAVAARQGGDPAPLSVRGGSIPPSGGVQVTLGNDVVIIRDEGELAGTLLDVHGTLTKDQSSNFGKYTFTRDEPGQAVRVPDDTPFITDLSVEYRSAGTIIWAGHNDLRYSGPEAVVQNIADMVSSLDTDRYVVLGLTNGTNNGEGTPFYEAAMLGVNPALEAAYGPDHYLDIRAWLVENGLSAAGLEPTAEDEQNLAEDIVPVSLRDPLATGHLNATGYTLVAQHLDEFLRAQGWY